MILSISNSPRSTTTARDPPSFDTASSASSPPGIQPRPYLVFLAEMMFLHGKMYYVAPVYPMMFAAGAVWIEGATGRRLWIWVKPALALARTAICGIYV